VSKCFNIRTLTQPQLRDYLDIEATVNDEEEEEESGDEGFGESVRRSGTMPHANRMQRTFSTTSTKRLWTGRQGSRLPRPRTSHRRSWIFELGYPGEPARLRTTTRISWDIITSYLGCPIPIYGQFA